MLLDFLKKDVTPFHLVNTGTILDIATGAFMQGVNNTWILEGGLSQTMGITGRGQTFKSSLAGSFIAKALAVHPLANAFIYETEGTVSGASFYDRFVDEPVSERIVFRNNTTDDLTEFYNNILELVKAKEAQRKELIVESPFVDPSTGKPQKIWVPTFVLIDSYSRASSAKADAAIDENNIDSSALNTWHMINGNVKTKLLADFITKATKYGIYAIITAHVGNKINLDARPTRKEMQYMMQDDKLKNVGSNFTFLTTCMMQTLRASIRTNSAKASEYPRDYGSGKKSTKASNVEINEVETRIIRNKNNVSGLGVNYIVSQFQGVLDAVTNFEFVRNNDYYGLNVKGNNVNFSTKLTPDINFTKTTLRKDSHDKYELTRALEILAQLCYVQENWDLSRLPSVLSTPIDTVAEVLSQCEKSLSNRILNSTGVWSTSKLARERLTLLDILLLVDKEIKSGKIKLPTAK